MAYEEHVQRSQSIVARCAVVTLSDTRTEATDKSGRMIRELLEKSGHSIGHYSVVRDEPADLQPLLVELLGQANLDVVITNGGTGISRRDQTVLVLERHITQPLPGFGELFRMLSWQEIGSGAMLSRAIAGISNGKLLFALPGSTAAVELGMTKLILPELKHLLSELRK